MKFGTFREHEVETVAADTLIGTAAEFRRLAELPPGAYRVDGLLILISPDPERPAPPHIPVEAK